MKKFLTYVVLGCVCLSSLNLNSYAAETDSKDDKIVIYNPDPHLYMTIGRLLNNNIDFAIESYNQAEEEIAREKEEAKRKEEEAKRKAAEEKKRKEAEAKKKQQQQSSKAVETGSGYVKVNLSDSEVYMLAQLIYLEAGNCSYKCQCAVGSVAINLMLANGTSLSNIVHNRNIFSVANSVDYTKPSSTSLEAARQIANSGTTVPKYVKYFRNRHYFSWATPYMNLDNVYFSY